MSYVHRVGVEHKISQWNFVGIDFYSVNFVLKHVLI